LAPRGPSPCLRKAPPLGGAEVRDATNLDCRALVLSRDAVQCRMQRSCANWRRVCWRSPWTLRISNCSNGFASGRVIILTKPLRLKLRSPHPPMLGRQPDETGWKVFPAPPTPRLLSLKPRSSPGGAFHLCHRRPPTFRNCRFPDRGTVAPARRHVGAVAFVSFTLRLSKNAIRYLFGAPCC